MGSLRLMLWAVLGHVLGCCCCCCRLSLGDIVGRSGLLLQAVLGY